MNVEDAQLSMNIFDAVIIGVVVISVIVGLFRGFVREILSLMAWVGAAVITIYLFPQSTQFMKHYIKSEHIAAGSAALGTYMCALLTLSLLNAIILKYVKTGSEVGVIDNVFGLGFGAVRGAFIVSLAFLIISAVIPKEKEKQPKWLQGSVTKPYLQDGAQMLAKMAPTYLSNLEEIVRKQQANDKLKDAEEGLDEAVKEGEDAVEGSKTNTRKAIERMMRNGEKYKEDITNDRP